MPILFWKERARKKYCAELKNRRHQEDDLLSPEQKRRFDAILEDLSSAPREEAGRAVADAKAQIARFPFPQKRGTIYATLDLLIVVGAVAFGLRGLFFQPFRIPTGSMQPTLFGLHYISREAATSFVQRSKILQGGVTAKAVVPESGMLTSLSRKNGFLFDTTLFTIGSSELALPGALPQVVPYAHLDESRHYQKGETLADGLFVLGDHLFVERLSLYLRPPVRGDVMVFNTEGLSVNGTPLTLTSGYFYIKRIAGLPGDTVKIVDDQLYVKPLGETDFRKIQEIAPKFRKIYSGKGGYHGHLSRQGSFPFAYGHEYIIPADRYLMLGDNSRNSLDSRYFGTVHRDQLVGRAWIVFYPFSRRWGLVDRQEPLDRLTDTQSMFLQ